MCGEFRAPSPRFRRPLVVVGWGGWWPGVRPQLSALPPEGRRGPEARLHRRFQGRLLLVPLGLLVGGPRVRPVVLGAPGGLLAAAFPPPAAGAAGPGGVEACGLCGTDHEQYTGALAGGSRSSPATRPWASSRRSVSGPPSGGVSLRATGSRSRCSSRAGRAPCRPASTAAASGTAWPTCTASSRRQPPGLWGGYAEHQYLAPDSMLLPVPERSDPLVATCSTPSAPGFGGGSRSRARARRRGRRARPRHPRAGAPRPRPRRPAPAS